jgi:transposase InsO family protein
MQGHCTESSVEHDFVTDQLADGRRFRALTIVDVFTRESLAIEAGQSLKGGDVMRVLSRICAQRAVPKTSYCDNGSEFTSQAMDLWAYHTGVQIDFSRPGKPTDNTYRSTDASIGVLGRPLVRNVCGSETGDRSLASGI